MAMTNENEVEIALDSRENSVENSYANVGV